MEILNNSELILTTNEKELYLNSFPNEESVVNIYNHWLSNYTDDITKSQFNDFDIFLGEDLLPDNEDWKLFLNNSIEMRYKKGDIVLESGQITKPKIFYIKKGRVRAQFKKKRRGGTYF